MARSMHDGELDVANLELLPIGEFTVGRRRLFELHPVNLRLPTRRFVQPSIEGMEIDGHVPSLLDECNRANVIDVSMRYPDGLERRGC